MGGIKAGILYVSDFDTCLRRLPPAQKTFNGQLAAAAGLVKGRLNQKESNLMSGKLSQSRALLLVLRSPLRVTSPPR